MSIELYEHNQKTYDNMKKLFLQHDYTAIVQPMGSGKSLLFLKWIEQHPQDKSLILSPSNYIFNQLEIHQKKKKQSLKTLNI